MNNTEVFREIINSRIRTLNLTFPSSHPQLSSFTLNAIELRKRLASIECFISRISRSYVLVRPLLLSEIPFLSNNERSVIDDNLERQLHESSRWLDQLKDEVKKSKVNGDIRGRGIREHNQIVVVSLLARLSKISQRVSRLQAAHYEAVLLSQSPFTTWLSTPKIDKYVDVFLGDAPLISSKTPSGAPNTLLKALSSTITISDVKKKVDRVRSRGATNLEDWAYALLLTCAHTHLTTRLGGLADLGSPTLRILSQQLQVAREEWRRVATAAVGCWHWAELRSKLLEGAEFNADDVIVFEAQLPRQDKEEAEFRAYVRDATTSVEPLCTPKPTSPKAITQLKKKAIVAPSHVEGHSATRTTVLQQQVIEAEHENLGVELAGELDAVLKTEMKMREVSDIMSMFSDKVAAQAEDMGAIFDTTESVVDDVDAGHEQLIAASKRRRVARHIYVTITLMLSFIILFLDFVLE